MSGSLGSGIRASIEALPRQIRQGWELGRMAVLPPAYKKTTHAVVSGMGGSSLGAHVMLTACAERLKIPVELVNGYDLPSYVSEDTLVILSSYSGTTEETLATANQAAKKGAKCVVLTVGGALGDLAKKKRWPLLLLDAENNPSNQPRMGVGSSAMAIHGIFAALGHLKLTDADVKKMERAAAQDESATAKTLASRIGDRALFFLASEHLLGAAHVANNQVNENAKRISTFFALPEFNHHFLEGLSYPTQIKRDLVAVLFQSERYHPQNQKRVALTAEQLSKNRIEPIIVTLDGGGKLEEAWRLIRLGASLSLELALRQNIDPEPVPNVEAFKKALASK
ncbi:SIS domain-containing protein [Patescibacteria group bacterium]|jgi:glucose/mannose-6-phosphate isomerase|nr:SIS domain-containing protein [Patescibacteria group bacterium]